MQGDRAAVCFWADEAAEMMPPANHTAECDATGSSRNIKVVQPSRRAFTLIEILVVIVVIAILASLVAPNIFQNVGAAKDATARSQIEMLGAALDAYRLDNGKYPPTTLGLDALNTKPVDESASNWRGPYLRKAVPLDPWRHPYVYKAPGEVNPHGYDLISYGADGQPGGEGENADIVSWK